MDPLAPESRRPRPVAGLPAVDARAITKSWLLELMAASTLEDAVELPVRELAREGPGIAAAVLEALSDDGALRRLAPGGNLGFLSGRAAGLIGPGGPASAVRATEALRRATQAAILAEARLDAPTTAELTDRLAHVCAMLAEAVADQAFRETQAGVAAPEPAVAEPEPEPDDEEPASGPILPEPRPEPLAQWSSFSPQDPRSDPVEALRRRVERRAEAGSWEAAVERRLERHTADGSPFALLAIEADGVERLRAAQVGDEVDALLEDLERALAAELRPADQLLADSPGRYWVTAPDTGPAVAKLLAGRLAEAARAAVAHAGQPLTVSIGVATCPDDGSDLEALSTRADSAMFSARAAGTPVG